MADDADVERKLTKTVRRAYVDAETGEQRTLIHEEPLKRRPRNTGKSAEPFGLIFPEGARHLATLGLTGFEHTVLWHLVGIMGFEEPFRCSPTEIGKAVGADRRNIAKVLGRLRRLGVIIDMPDRRILIDPNLVWRGSILARMEILTHLSAKPKPRPEEGTP